MGFTLVGVVLAALVVLGTGFHNFKAQLERYANVPIQGNKDEVLYRLGYPPQVLGEPEKVDPVLGEGWDRRVYYTDREIDPKNAMPADKRPKDYNGWVYNTTHLVTVTFDAKSNAIESIECMSPASGGEPCESLLGVASGATEEEVVRRLGRNYRYQLNGGTKELWYDDVGVEFYLTQGKVYMLELHRSHGSNAAVFMRYLRTINALRTSSRFQ